jgi:hypothetical protein
MQIRSLRRRTGHPSLPFHIRPFSGCSNKRDRALCSTPTEVERVVTRMGMQGTPIHSFICFHFLTLVFSSTVSGGPFPLDLLPSSPLPHSSFKAKKGDSSLVRRQRQNEGISPPSHCRFEITKRRGFHLPRSSGVGTIWVLYKSCQHLIM